MPGHKSFARFVTFPENESAFLAIQDLIKNLRLGKSQRSPNPLFLHGPPGTGKSHLLSGLAREIAGGAGLTVQCLAASDFRVPRSTDCRVACKPRWQPPGDTALVYCCGTQQASASAISASELGQ